MRQSQPCRDPEDKKVIVKKSHWIALSRTIVHVVPVSTSTILIAMNLKGVYLGPSLGSGSGLWTTTYTLAALQVATKVQSQLVFNHDFWLNGTSDDLWPTSLTSAHRGDLSPSEAQGNDSCSLSTSISNSHCVSKGYPKIYNYFNSVPDFFSWDWTLLLRELSFPRVIGGAEAVGSTSPETWAFAPHIATAFRQNQLWWDRSWFRRFNANGRASTVESQMAALPNLKEYEFYTYNIQSSAWTKAVAVSPDLWSKDGQSFIDRESVKTQWIEYTAEAVTAGVVIMEAMTNISLPTRSILACAVDARWAKAQSQQIDGPISPSQAAVTATALHQRLVHPIEGYTMNIPEVSSHGFLPVNDTSWRPITASLDWLEALTPEVPYISPTLNLSTPASTLANIFMSTNHTSIAATNNTNEYMIGTLYNFFETVISTLVADGISRVGYASQLESATFYANGAESACRSDILPNVCPGPPLSEDFTMMHIRGDLTDSTPLPSIVLLQSPETLESQPC
ncbi:hypothetical protein OEA41_001640 [Lepraria neglecta]|uniref:Uncharacterized protein n=1 Tax=Lepraria neglecta TaxID=209136 RepID=A0AAD9Z9Z3_9LECA|nr:hypothetical protein OEA41_001640 [Lepraria neglecta]